MMTDEECCRICMTVYATAKLISINEHKNGGKPINLINYLFDCTIHRYDKLPQGVCQKCYNKLKRACELKTIFLHSDKQFRNALTQQINANIQDISENFEENCKYNDSKETFIETMSTADSIDKRITDTIKIEEERFQSVVTVYENHYVQDTTNPLTINQLNISKVSAQADLEYYSQPSLSPPQAFLNTETKIKLEKIDLEAHPGKKLERIYGSDVFIQDDLEIIDLQPKVVLQKFCQFIFECPDCFYKTSTRLEIIAHCESAHPREKERIWCKYCSRTFRWQSSLETHNKKVHPECSWTCDYCAEIFYSPHLIISHFRHHISFKSCVSKNTSSISSNMDEFVS